ncbi:MAG: UDP-N-acetylmuramate dehydrogenase [Treponema sp.]|jgi:UDP-N-acetylmuramate dehydrogenase|nr:UDP-N-acetylmuramate dehydrogenase [Treponema sp.]
MFNVLEFWKDFNSRRQAFVQRTSPGGPAAPFTGDFRFNEPMAEHTTLKTGGPADLWIRPALEDWSGPWVPEFLEAARRAEIPVFVLGGGANLAVSSRGIRGIVLDTLGHAGLVEDPPSARDGSGASRILRFRSGTALDYAAETAAALGLSGLEFFAGMPGSAGGGLWMNARCYGREVAEAAVEAVFLDRGGARTVVLDRKTFGYKTSPFQGMEGIILSVSFALHEKDPAGIREVMETYRRDREAKGHYRFPSAGSVFKNNRTFGKPAGRIIDELGLRGLSRGDAQVAPWHGNIIINRGKARGEDIRALAEEVRRRVKDALEIDLEPEILFAGDWAAIPGKPENPPARIAFLG